MYVLYRIGAGVDYKWMKNFDINKPIPGFNYLLGQVGWFSEHIPVDNNLITTTRRVEYVCEKGWDHAGFFVSYTGSDVRC